VATPRKYKPRGYRDGGVVTPMPADAVTIDNIAVAPPIEAPPPLPEPVPPPLADDNDAMVRALHAQTRAEEIQRNAAKPPNHQRHPRLERAQARLPARASESP
jgi:hypothetical protein